MKSFLTQRITRYAIRGLILSLACVFTCHALENQADAQGLSLNPFKKADNTPSYNESEDTLKQGAASNFSLLPKAKAGPSWTKKLAVSTRNFFAISNQKLNPWYKPKRPSIPASPTGTRTVYDGSVDDDASNRQLDRNNSSSEHDHIVNDKKDVISFLKRPRVR